MPSRIPSLNWLRVFEAAARTSSFTRAAETLNMSPPAVGQQIKALEEHLGRELFTRGPRSVTLTEAGRAFLPSVAQSLHTVEVATNNLFGSRERQTLTVQCSLMLACGWLAPRLPGFQIQHPEIQVNLMTGILEEEFNRAGADLRILFGVSAARHEDADPLFGETLYPVAPPEIADQIRSAGDLAHWPLVEIATHRANWFAILPPHGPEPRFTYTDTTVAALAIAASGAIALAREPASGALPTRHGLVRCLPDLEAKGVQAYSLVRPGGAPLSKAARSFRNWLLEEASQSSRS